MRLEGREGRGKGGEVVTDAKRPNQDAGAPPSSPPPAHVYKRYHL